MAKQNQDKAAIPKREYTEGDVAGHGGCAVVVVGAHLRTDYAGKKRVESWVYSIQPAGDREFGGGFRPNRGTWVNAAQLGSAPEAKSE